MGKAKTKLPNQTQFNPPYVASEVQGKVPILVQSPVAGIWPIPSKTVYSERKKEKMNQRL